MAGRRFSPRFVAHTWDGRVRLAKALPDGSLRFPAGMANDVMATLREQGTEFDFEDCRRFPASFLRLAPVDGLRPYQCEALTCATTPQGALGTIGRGIVKMPPRAGKTRTAAAIIARLGVRTLFLVPATFLLHQTRQALEKALKVDVGVMGDGEWNERDINVASFQTLSSARGRTFEKYFELLQRTDLVIADEIHHLKSETWRQALLDSDAPYKLGLSATVFFDNERETELGVIWLHACTGDILIDVPMSDLIDQNYLVRPEVSLHVIRKPDLGRRRWSQKLHKDAIILNDYRNDKIAAEAFRMSKEGLRVVVISSRLEQVVELCDRLDKLGVRYACLTGETKTEDREREVSRFKNGDILVLVGTIFDEGVDIPEIDAVVIAEGGSDIKRTYQRLRCLTPHAGKQRAFIVDFVDLTHPYFAEHSRSRMGVYRKERAFKVSVVDG
jgi:superfamily II DNA or RNA helicase